MEQQSAADNWNAHWAELSLSGKFHRNLELTSAIEQHIGLEGTTILEVGGGSGGDSAYLAGLGAQVILVDYSTRALQLARNVADHAGVCVDFVMADALRLPFRNEAFQVVFHQGLLEHFPDPRSVLMEQVRVLEPDGLLLVDVPQTYSVLTLRKRWLMRRGRWFAGWETQYSIRELISLFRQCGLEPVGAYGRGYAPKLLYYCRHLRHLTGKKLGRELGPTWVWDSYSAAWARFERSRLALYVQESIGLIGLKGRLLP